MNRSCPHPPDVDMFSRTRTKLPCSFNCTLALTMERRRKHTSRACDQVGIPRMRSSLMSVFSAEDSRASCRVVLFCCSSPLITTTTTVSRRPGDGVSHLREAGQEMYLGKRACSRPYRLLTSRNTDRADRSAAAQQQSPTPPSRTRFPCFSRAQGSKKPSPPRWSIRSQHWGAC